MRRRAALTWTAVLAGVWLLRPVPRAPGPAGPPRIPGEGEVAVRTHNWQPVHGAGWTLVAASLDVLGGIAVPGNGTGTAGGGDAAAVVELAFFLAGGEPRRSELVQLVSDAFERPPEFVLGDGGAVGSGTAVALKQEMRDLARLLCPLTAAGLERLRGMVGRRLAVQVADGAGFRAAFDLDVVALDPSAAAGRIVLCTQVLRNRSVLENRVPDATRIWLEHHFSNGAADAAVVYDVDGSFAPTAAALVARGRDVTYFPRWHGMPVPAPPGGIQQVAALHHCLALARGRAEWALHLDPDEYLVCRRGHPLARMLGDPARPDVVRLERAFFTHPEPAAGGDFARTRFPELCWRTPKPLFRTSTAASPDVHRLFSLRASAGGGKPRELRPGAGAARVNHYFDMVAFRNRTDCQRSEEEGTGWPVVVEDGWGPPGEECRPPRAVSDAAEG